MYTLSQLRNQVDALQRKYARELAVYRLRPLAEDFSQQWAIALSNRQPAPQPQPFIRRIAQRGFCFNTFMALDNYLERCRSEGIIPHCQGMLHSLLPQLPYDRLRSMLQWDTPARPSGNPAFLPSFLRRQEPLAARVFSGPHSPSAIARRMGTNKHE